VAPINVGADHIGHGIGIAAEGYLAIMRLDAGGQACTITVPTIEDFAIIKHNFLDKAALYVLNQRGEFTALHQRENIGDRMKRILGHDASPNTSAMLAITVAAVSQSQNTSINLPSVSNASTPVLLSSLTKPMGSQQ
jgi:hypothetical protein